jgi:hypothetical protein
MKKLFLFASIAALVAACGKNDDNNPTPPNQGGQGGGQQTQQTTPTPVPAGFVKTIKEYLREETESALQKTTTYTVENNILKGWETVYPNGVKNTTTLTYEGPHLKTYKQVDIEPTGGSITVLFEYTYENNKLSKIVRTRDGKTDIYNITLDDQGRIIKKKCIPTNNSWEGQEWEATFTYEGNKLTVQKAQEQKNIYTYTGKNVVKMEQEPTLGVTTEVEYDTTVVNDLNNPYVYLTNIAQLFTRHGLDLYPGNENDPFIKGSQNVYNKFMFYTYTIDKNGQKPTKITKKDNGGNTVDIKTYTYY